MCVWVEEAFLDHAAETGMMVKMDKGRNHG
jgi:hypothetical protein